ncbi:TPA: hypothetical protein GE500_27040 [Escherichia coli]|nr:hypothetical protein [Escherichia coli]
MRKSLHFLSATSRLLNTQTEIVSQRILQFFEISDLRIVTKICVGAQINGDYCRLRAAFGKRTILYGCVIALGRYTVFGRPLGT